jgi:hypothetical protein
MHEAPSAPQAEDPEEPVPLPELPHTPKYRRGKAPCKTCGKLFSTWLKRREPDKGKPRHANCPQHRTTKAQTAYHRARREEAQRGH